MIYVNNLCKAFGDHVVLKDIKSTNSNIYVISDPIFKEILGGK